MAMERVDGDKLLLAELAGMFLDDYPRLMRELRDSTEARDYAVAERTAHTLKGRLAFFGLEKARDLALRLEMMGRQCEMTEAPPVISDLDAVVQSALPEFRSLSAISG